MSDLRYKKDNLTSSFIADLLPTRKAKKLGFSPTETNTSPPLKQLNSELIDSSN